MSTGKSKDRERKTELGQLPNWSNIFSTEDSTRSSSPISLAQHEMSELGREQPGVATEQPRLRSSTHESLAKYPSVGHAQVSRPSTGIISPFSDREAISSNMASEVDLSHKQTHIFKSYLLNGKYDQPWKNDKRLRTARKGNVIIYIVILLALALSAFINYSATTSVPTHPYCLVLDDSFSTLDPNVWNHEVQINGFGTDSFDWTTTDSKNAFVDDEGLHIVPTLTTDTTPITKDQIINGFTLNLTTTGGDGSCTANSSDLNYNVECSILSNSTSKQIIPPVRSARLNTKGHKSIRYGRVEVTAKLPVGDWLWPAIWMMPEDSVYGPWPLSGEIDIMESRGNPVNYTTGGRDIYSSTLHWGPTTHTDSFWRTTWSRWIRRSDYTKDFHTYGIEWSQDYIFTYFDSPLQRVFYIDFKKHKDLWTFGNFAGMTENNTIVPNPWAKSSNANAPFDQNFFLILNVAVGGRNGWFPDNEGSKPWWDQFDYAASDFYSAIDKWYPTWGSGNDKGMTVKRVRMWQEGTC